MAHRTRTVSRHGRRSRHGHRPLTRNEKLGLGGLVSVLAVGALVVAAGVLLDRLMDFDDALDAGGEWDEGGGVFTRWD